MKLNHAELDELLALDEDVEEEFSYEIDDYFGDGAYPEDAPEYLSDLDVSIFGSPMAEWDGPMGRYWVTYDSEEDRNLALAFNNAEWDRYNRAYKKLCNLGA